jgi:hypothetical protein
VPAQFGFTEYVPLIIAWNMLPFMLTQVVAVVPPFPSTSLRRRRQRACLEGCVRASFVGSLSIFGSWNAA